MHRGQASKKNEKNEDVDRSGKRDLKVVIIALVIAGVLYAGFYYVGASLPPAIVFPEDWNHNAESYEGVEIAPRVMGQVDLSRDPEEYPDEYDTKAKYYAYYKTLEMEQKRDSFGSSTPEGTFNAFVRALENREIEKAARYFVPEKEGVKHKEFQVGVDNNNIDFLLGFLKEANGPKRLSKDEAVYNVLRDNTVYMSFYLVQNHHTSVWKMESL